MKIEHERIGKNEFVFGNEFCTNTKPNTITCHSGIQKLKRFNQWEKFMKSPMLTFKDKKTTFEFFKVIHIA